MTLDGIPETLPPVAETAERSRFPATELRPLGLRRRSALRQEPEDDQLEDDARESHVLDDRL